MVRRDELLILVFQCAAWWSARLPRRVGAGSTAGWWSPSRVAGSGAAGLWRGQGHDPGERVGDVAGPGPCGGYAQVAAALAFDDPPGCVQDLVAQRFRLGFGEVAVEGEEAEPGEQVAGGGRGLAPGGAGPRRCWLGSSWTADGAGRSPWRSGSGPRPWPGSGGGLRGTGPARPGCWSRGPGTSCPRGA